MLNSSLNQVKCIICGAWGPQNAFNKRAGHCLVCYQHMGSTKEKESNTMLNEAEINKLFDKEITDAESGVQSDIAYQQGLIAHAKTKILMLEEQKIVLSNKLKRIQGLITKTPKE